MKGKMADTYSYVSGELRCALFPLFVDGILRNTNKKKCSKWSHQNNFAHFLVSTRPNLLLFSNKRKTVKIGQNAFTLNQGDTPLVCHKYDLDLSSVITKRLEQTQYAASLVVTGAWRGTSKQKIYDEPETIVRRLCHFFKLKLTQYPAYLFSLIPPERQISNDLRNPQAYAQNRVRTDRFSNSYFHNTLHEWKKLPTKIHASTSIAEFKRKLIALIRPVKNTIYGVSDLKGIRNITKLRVQFSDLNAHKFNHNFECLRPI